MDARSYFSQMGGKRSDADELESIRRELMEYAIQKPGRVPSADSPNRPALGRLWKAADAATSNNRRQCVFKYLGCDFLIVYMGGRMAVLDLRTHNIVVRAPFSNSGYVPALSAAIY